MAKKTYDLELTGFVGGEDFDAKTVLDYLRDHADEEVMVLIDSTGGLLSTGLTIGSAFRNHGNVTVHLTGLNASAATIASIGAKRVTMDSSAMYLVHKSSLYFFEWGSKNADDMEQLIDRCSKDKDNLDKIDRNVATLYARRCKRDVEELLTLMKNGGWLTAEEAKDWGFIDELDEDGEDEMPILSDALAAAMAAEGIPVPPITRSPAMRSGGFERFFEIIADCFRKEKSSKPKHKTMDKSYTKICACLAMADIPLSDGNAVLSDVQLKSIEDALQAADTENQIAEQKIKELQAKLDKTPAEQSAVVTDGGKGPKNDSDSFADFIDTGNAAAKLFNSLP